MGDNIAYMGKKWVKKVFVKALLKALGEKYWCKKCGSNFENFVKYLGGKLCKMYGCNKIHG